MANFETIRFGNKLVRIENKKNCAIVNSYIKNHFRIRNEKCDATDACLCEDYFGRISNESWTDNCWTFSPFKSFDPTKRNEKKEISYLDSVNGSIILTIANRLPPTVGYIISSLGGFYSAIYGIYVLFFGPGKQSPWGLTQKYMCCWDIRREYERKLAKRYVSEANIPLVDPFPYKDTDENRLGTITKDRIERLETMLEECYLDASYFKTLKGVVKANEAYKKEYGLK
ncbi:hypothetical protein RhiirA5_380562 [Rhizophagus irregularis]|uniref:Uncharacterized protein n=1 Tax=Rhizophagus irregularis TaxID=588596 RepID=A0A2N0P7Y8_9GLOM|nr:hypothetical protein RhiirA5_380562 [Rhizophagus irregularis]